MWLRGGGGIGALPTRRWLVLFIALVATAVALAGCGDDDSGSDACAGKEGLAGQRPVTIESMGRARTFVLSVPESALRGAAVPLVVVYHGVLSNGATIQEVTGFPDKAAAEGFITVAGDGVERSWNAGVCCEPAQSLQIDDVAFTRDMIAAVEAEYCVDPQRIYATGFSNGSAMVFRLVCEASDLFAAFAPVGGSLALIPCEPSQARPIEIINNVDDPIVPFALGADFSFPQAMAWNQCAGELSGETPAANAECRVARDCAQGVRTGFCAVDGLSHVWPGGGLNPDGPFSATDHVWSFFAATAAE